MWKRIVGLIAAAWSFVGCQPATAEVPTVRTPALTPAFSKVPPPARETWLPSSRLVTGNLADQIASLLEFAPRSGSNGFVEPGRWQMIAFGHLVDDIQTGNIDQAVRRAAGLDYELIEYADRGDANARSYLVRETKPIRKGWGLYVIRIDSASQTIIEAPHLISDQNTPLVALSLFRAVRARALLVAGAHREANDDSSADVAHNPLTIFQAAHQSLAASQEYLILQIHGFASGKHPGYPQVVISSNQAAPSGLIDDLAAGLTANQISVGVCDGASWLGLCGTTNVQLTSTNSGIFVHVELDETIRDNPQGFTSALGQVLRRWERGKVGDLGPGGRVGGSAAGAAAVPHGASVHEVPRVRDPASVPNIQLDDNSRGSSSQQGA